MFVNDFFITRKLWSCLMRFAVLSALFCLAPCLPVVNAGRVEQVSVDVVDLTGLADTLVLQRMATSLQVVSEQILSGKETAYLQANNYVYATILSDIGNRVFTGYNVESVLIKQAAETQIQVCVSPWQAVTKSTEVNIYLSGIDSLWFELINSNISGLDAQVQNILTGISIDAVDWAGTLAKNHIRDSVNENLPSFKAHVDIIPGENVVVDIVLLPVGNSVQDVNYELRSDTMPTLVLLDAKTTLGNYADSLRGLPLDFLQENQEQIRTILQEYTEQERIVKNYVLDVDIDIVPKNNTDVTITLDSSRYRFWIEGYVDVNRDDDNLSGTAHLGKLISDKDEIFLETTFYINNIKWKFDPGISRSWGSTRVGILYRMPDDQTILRLEYKFLKNWQIRIDKFSHTGRPELALRYRIHEFMAAEFIVGRDKENYFRIVGNL